MKGPAVIKIALPVCLGFLVFINTACSDMLSGGDCKCETENTAFIISFDSQGGSPVSPVIVECDDIFEAPADPIRTGFNLIGWYREAGCINPWDFMVDTVTENMTLYAQWQWSMISVPGGTFTRYADFNWDGDVGDANESVVSTIASFDMAQYVVTYDLWFAVYQWAITHGYIFANFGTEGSSAGAAVSSILPTTRKYEPVTCVNWRDAIVWCNAFSEMEGYTAVYENASNVVIKDATNTTDCDAAIQEGAADGYRLPSISEWKYAAGYIDGVNFTPWTYASGDSAPYDTSTTIGDYAWYVDNSDGITHDVGQKYPNALNIYDMSGNVWEWCFDWHPLQVGSARCREGGGWESIARWLILGDGYYSVQSLADPHLGFRVARSAD